MSNSIKLTLYTQNLCGYCEVMKRNLNLWGYDYDIINVENNPQALSFLRLEGHKTVPQLYYKRTHINKVDTAVFTKEMLEEAIDPDNFSGGVEHWR
tara:strand:+ start:215 stop:502 length:288 start_codon:yes stop_codon:yes gene_type:complete